MVAADSLDMDRLYRASRYGKGGGDDYLNAPMDREEYVAFVAGAARRRRRSRVKEFEREIPYFEGCLPIEVMAERGIDTLRYGPMKPVGLRDPRTGRIPHAVVQLRRDDLAADALEPGRLPDPHDVRRAAARCFASSRASSTRASLGSA